MIIFLLLSAATCIASAQDDGTGTIVDVAQNDGTGTIVDVAQNDGTGTIVDVAQNDGNFTTLLTALDAANLTDTLRGKGPFTVFAPTDKAFAALPNGTIEALLNDTSALKKILLYHVAEGKLTAEDVASISSITTLEGSELPVNVTDQGVFVGNAMIKMADINTSNGVIHIIDSVLIPPEKPSQEKDIIKTEEDEGNFTTLLTALDAANLTDTLRGKGPFTVFAPTDKAFAALPNGTIEALLNDTSALKKILLYHVAEGKLTAEDVASISNITTLEGSELPVNVTDQGILVGNAMITMSDINASNGVIHVIDSVLMPPEQPSQEKDIIKIAEDSGKFKTLLTALKATKLTCTLKEKGPFTVFAPTDKAFAALPKGTLESLLNDKDSLKKILLYHVEKGRFTAKDVAKMKYITTLEGKKLLVTETDKGVFVGKAKIIVTDISASNGVIHEIDAVLIPPEQPSQEKDIIEAAKDAGKFKTLLTALDSAKLTCTLKGKGPFTVFAPTDKAFAALPEGTLDSLLKDTGTLKKILLYHVEKGRFTAKDVAKMKYITTLEGKKLPVTVTSKGVFVGKAKIVITDIETSNGVIHEIDAVLIPPKK